MRNKKINKVFLMGLLSLAFFVSAIQIGATITENQSKITYNLEGDLVTNQSLFKKDGTTNLLLDQEGTSLLEKIKGDYRYHLTDVTITRHRRPVKIEYYVGDYNQSEYLGFDQGYVDFGDSINQYILKTTEINEKFGATVPNSYKLVPLIQGTSFGNLLEYDGTDNTLVIKVLAAEVVKHSITVSTYFNREDIQNPTPVGKSKAMINGKTEYWNIHNLTTSVNAINGQRVNIKSAGLIKDSYTTSGALGRTGQLAYSGYFGGGSGEFIAADTMTIDNTNTATKNFAAFYEVDDFGKTPSQPGTGSGITSGVGITFAGGNSKWKAPSVSETLSIDDFGDISILEAYPFHENADVFKSPEYSLLYLPANWMLAHELTITYNYAKGEKIPTIDPTPEGEKEKPTITSPVEAAEKEETTKKQSPTVLTSDITTYEQPMALLVLALIGVIVSRKQQL